MTTERRDSPRKGFGGPQPGSGRPKTGVKRHVILLTDLQWVEFKRLDGSPWLQGAMNLLLAKRPDALVMLLLDKLTEKHGREWLQGLGLRIQEKAARAPEDGADLNKSTEEK